MGTRDEAGKRARHCKLVGAALREPVELTLTHDQSTSLEPSERGKDGPITNLPGEADSVWVPHDQREQPRLGHPTR